MGRNGARAPRTGTKLGTLQARQSYNRTIGGSSIGFLAGLWFLLVLLWWAIKVVALVIFIIAIIAVVGALLNDNPVASHDIAWAIISFVALIVL